MMVALLMGDCGEESQECNERFLNPDCQYYCWHLTFKNGVCILTEGLVGPKPPKYKCCCYNS